MAALSTRDPARSWLHRARGVLAAQRGEHPMKRTRARIAGIDSERVDVLLMIVIIAALELEIWLGSGIAKPHRPLTAVAAVLFGAPLAVRRRWPAGALVCCSAVATIQAPLGGRLGTTSGLGMMLALVLLAYSTGAWLDLRRGVLALILGGAAFSGFVFLSGPGTPASARACSLLASCSLRHGSSVGLRASAPVAWSRSVSSGYRPPPSAGSASGPRSLRSAHADRARAAGHHCPQRQRNGDPGRWRRGSCCAPTPSEHAPRS